MKATFYASMMTVIALAMPTSVYADYTESEALSQVQAETYALEDNQGPSDELYAEIEALT